MSGSKHVVLVHGTWGRGDTLRDARREFEARGFTVHTPALRYHDLPLTEGALRVATVSLYDYVDDLVTLVGSLDAPPLLVGHSLGGLLAQLVAVRTNPVGLVAATPGPAAGIFASYPGALRAFGMHFLQIRPWTKPLPPPSWKLFRSHFANITDEQTAREYFPDLVCDSGRVYCEMLWFLDRTKASRVDFEAVAAPVLAIGARRDRVVNWRVARTTAKRYQRGTYIELPDSDHLVLHGDALPVTMAHIDKWMLDNGIFAPA